MRPGHPGCRAKRRSAGERRRRFAGLLRANPAGQGIQQNIGVVCLSLRVFVAGIVRHVPGIIVQFVEVRIAVAVQIAARRHGIRPPLDHFVREQTAGVAIPRILVVVRRRDPADFAGTHAGGRALLAGGQGRGAIFIHDPDHVAGEIPRLAFYRPSARAVLRGFEQAAGMAGIDHHDDLHAGRERRQIRRHFRVLVIGVVGAQIDRGAAVLAAVAGMVIEKRVARRRGRRIIGNRLADGRLGAGRVQQARHRRIRPAAALDRVRVDVIGVRHATAQPIVRTDVARVVLVQPHEHAVVRRLRRAGQRRRQTSNEKKFFHASLPADYRPDFIWERLLFCVPGGTNEKRLPG